MTICVCDDGKRAGENPADEMMSVMWSDLSSSGDSVGWQM
jgi:hypothetical protein